VDTRPKTLVIQQEGAKEYSVLSPKPSERTATAYRFEVKVPGHDSQSLVVEQERTTFSSTEIMNTTPDFLLSIVQNRELGEQGRAQLKAILDLKRSIAATDNDLGAAKSQAIELTDDQTRLRQNIDSLNRVKGQEEQVRQYSAQLAENESKLAKLRDQRRELTDRRTNLDSRLRSAIESANF